jgi:hypothetical protein
MQELAFLLGFTSGVSAFSVLLLIIRCINRLNRKKIKNDLNENKNRNQNTVTVQPMDTAFLSELVKDLTDTNRMLNAEVSRQAVRIQELISDLYWKQFHLHEVREGAKEARLELEEKKAEMVQRTYEAAYFKVQLESSHKHLKALKLRQKKIEEQCATCSRNRLIEI